MKYTIRYTLLLIVGALLLGGCSKKTIIPDEELTKIAREMFLTNAYVSTFKVDADSMDIYTPILERYGYTQDDFFNTLANFQKRKSARLGDVMNATILDLEGLSEGYHTKVRNYKYIDSLAKAACVKEVYMLERVRVKSMKDTAQLRITLPIRDRGEYIVEYNYNIDTLDKNLRLQSEHATYDHNGKRLSLLRNNLTGGGTNKHSKTTITPKRGASRYELVLADYTRREIEPNITFFSLRVTYIPPIEEALALMDQELAFKPALYYDESMRIRSRYNNAPIPFLPTDTVWMPLDSIDLARAEELHLAADSLKERAEELEKRLDKLSTKPSDTKAAEQREELTKEIAVLLKGADESLQEADSLETAILGHPRKRE